MVISLVNLYSGYLYMNIQFNNAIHNTSKSIAELLGLPIDAYNDILIKKVIQHDKFRADFLKGKYEEKFIDVVFCINNISTKVYVDRFKEAFADQLILLTLSNS